MDSVGGGGGVVLDVCTDVTWSNVFGITHVASCSQHTLKIKDLMQPVSQFFIAAAQSHSVIPVAPKFLCTCLTMGFLLLR